MLLRLLAMTALVPLAIFTTPPSPLTPNPPVPFSFFSSVGSFVSVAGNADGYMAVWRCVNDSSIIWNFSSDNGATWTTPAPITVVSSTSTGPWITANATGFVVVWSDVSPGAPPGNVLSALSTDQGATWTGPYVIDNSDNTNGPVTVAATDSGFLTTWWSTDNSIKASFSSDGISWSSPVLIDHDTIDYPTASPIVTGFGNDFMVTWTTTFENGYSSFSSDRGSNWSTKSLLATSIPQGQLVWPAQNSDGYMAVWQNGGGNAYSSFSTNHGTTWQAPILIASHINHYYDPVAVIGTDLGFIVTTHVEDDFGQVSISTDDGANWAAFVPFTGSYSMSSGIYDCFASIALGTDGCMITWPDTNPNAISAFIPLSFAPLPPAGVSGQYLFNKFPFQSQYYNAISWQASPSAGVVGYHIHRNGSFLATTTELNYIDQSIHKNASYIYEITAYNSSGIPSSGVYVTINIP